MSDSYCWKDRTILIVEDDASSRLLLKAILVETGVQLLYAEDGETAVQIFRQHNNIDLVLMDIRLKGTNGLEATKRIKKIKPDIPVIAQTACALLNDVEKGYAAGCNAYLTKPLSTSALLEAINFYFQHDAQPELVASKIYAN